MLQVGRDQTLGYTTKRQKRATIATDNCFKVGYVCNVVVLYGMTTVGSTLHILPCGTVSTFCTVNLHSQTSKALLLLLPVIHYRHL